MTAQRQMLIQAINDELRRSIAQKLSSKRLSLTEELMGYSLTQYDVQRQYRAKAASSEDTPARRIAAPEVLAGLLRSTIT